MRAAQLSHRDSAQYRVLLHQNLAESTKTAKKQGKLMGVVDVGIKGSLLAAAWAGAALVRKEQLSSGVLTQFLLHTALLALGCWGLLGASEDYAAAVAAAGRVAQVGWACWARARTMLPRWRRRAGWRR